MKRPGSRFSNMDKVIDNNGIWAIFEHARHDAIAISANGENPVQPR
ncbi:hypothetical protein L810_3457 [Burkholderia sp. AU4i]|nr:hypothetical protein L810_3457 [Burkholderia sp. AU4i]